MKTPKPIQSLLQLLIICPALVFAQSDPTDFPELQMTNIPGAPDRALKNSLVDCFSEGASWRIGL